MLIGKSIQEIWGMLNSMQIVIHFSCMNIPVPGNVFFVNRQLNEALNVEMYPTDEIFPMIFNFNNKSAFSPQFESMGY